jgi:2,4-dienoyl-CoA reductase-like NADH-dependent reductase (Old Yellow Enzyme family)
MIHLTLDDTAQTPKLFSPLSIRGVDFPHRVWASPMCQYSADNGAASMWHVVHLGSFATGGVGLVMTESTAVAPEGRITVGCTGIWNQSHVKAWKPVVDFVHSMDTPIGIQLSHAGRKGSTMRPWDTHPIALDSDGGWETVGPSAIAYSDFPMPRELTIDEISQIVCEFAKSAKFSVEAGFDLVEIHGAHGYLVHQFLSPLSNQRTDEYGGSFKNRTRLLRELVSAIRAVIPTEMPLFLRISATDWADGGWDLAESVRLAQELRLLGVDLIDVSSGGLVHDANIKPFPGYQVELAREIREQAGIHVTTVGLITEPEHAEEILRNNNADAVMLGRALLRNPRWALNAAESLGYECRWPQQLQRARTINPRKSPQ